MPLLSLALLYLATTALSTPLTYPSAKTVDLDITRVVKSKGNITSALSAARRVVTKYASAPQGHQRRGDVSIIDEACLIIASSFCFLHCRARIKIYSTHFRLPLERRELTSLTYAKRRLTNISQTSDFQRNAGYWVRRSMGH
jgi:hypothetical protein